VGEKEQGVSFSPLHPRSGEVEVGISQDPGGRGGERMSWRLISDGRQHDVMFYTILVFLHLASFYFLSPFQLDQSLSNF